MIGIFNNLIRRSLKRSKEKDGMTIVEVVLAFLLIAIISTVLVRGTITAVNTMRINKSKTEALAIANEKIEIIKAIDYSDIIVTSEDDVGDPWMSYYSELPEEDGEFDITYEVIWVDAGIEGVVDIYKQVKISVFGAYMTFPVDVITQLYPPVGEEASIGNVYPPPADLTIEEPEVVPRKVILDWETPYTDKIISGYNIYRDGEFLDYSLDSFTYYHDYPENDLEYTYHVTAVYEGDIESVNSNTVTTGVPFVYPPPDNLIILGYSGGSGASRTVHLEWSEPDTKLTIIGYDIYGGTTLERTTALNYQDLIGISDYTYYIITVYDEDNWSAPSNSVTTELILVYPAPENLIITYSGGGLNKIAHLAWSAPDTELKIIEYQVYRDGAYEESTPGLSFDYTIGQESYIFYIIALYQIDNLSEPSNSEIAD